MNFSVWSVRNVKIYNITEYLLGIHGLTVSLKYSMYIWWIISFYFRMFLEFAQEDWLLHNMKRWIYVYLKNVVVKINLPLLE
jgi:hypothetical protein